jgi:hypothetical protein
VLATISRVLDRHLQQNVSARLSSPPMHIPARSSTVHRWSAIGTTVMALVALLGGCAAVGPAPEHEDAQLNVSPWAKANVLPRPEPEARWSHRRIASRPPSHYAPTQHAGRAALHARSERGDSLLRLPLRPSGPGFGRLRFSWFVPALNPEADLMDRELDDAVARVILQFSGDRSLLTSRDHMLSEMVQLVTGEPLPFATLIYVWDHRYPVGTVITHQRSERIKLMVVESGGDRLGQWVDFDRDVAADYRAAFGQPSDGLSGIALMTDSNNTGLSSQAWYGPLVWSREPS